MPKRKTTFKVTETKRAKTTIEVSEKLNPEVFEENLRIVVDNINKNEADNRTFNLLDKLFEDAEDDEERFKSLFIKIFNLLINQKYFSEKFISLLKTKIGRLPVSTLLECTTVFLDKIKLINQSFDFDYHMFDFCVFIMDILQKNKEMEAVESTFNEKINDLLKIEFNEFLALRLIHLFKIIILNKDQANLFIKKLFDEKQCKWSPTNLAEFFHEFIPLLGIYKTERGMGYEFIIFYFHRLNIQSENYVENQALYKTAETTALDCLVKLIKNDRSATEDFIDSIKPILEKNCKDKYFSRFTVALILTLTQIMYKQYRSILMTIFINSIQKLSEIDVYCSKYTWLATTMNVKPKSIFKKLSNLIEYHHLCEYIDKDIAFKSLIDLSINLLDYYGVSINMNTKAVTIRESLTCIATIILQDLFRNCVESRELICKNLLDAISLVDYSESVEKDSTVFVDQLLILFKSKSSKSHSAYNKNMRLQNLIIKYFLKSIFKLNLQCSVQLLNIFDGYLQVNNSNTKKLIELFKNHLNDANLEKKMISFYGLIVILRSFCSFKPITSVDQVTDSEASTNDEETKITKNDCLSLFNLIKEKLSRETDAEIKSHFYQSLREIISQNNELMEVVFAYLSEKLDDFVIKTSTQVFVKMDNCISNHNNFSLIEPIDVLLHCSHICIQLHKNCEKNERFGHSNLDHDAIKRHINNIESIFTALASTIIENTSQHVFSVYKKQTEHKLKTHTITCASSIRVLHQLQLGLIDALIEHEFSSQSFVTIVKLLEKYEQMSNLISIEIEDLMSPIISKAGKRREESETPRKSRRRLEIDENKENTPVRRSNSLHQLTPPTTPAKNLKKPMQNFSFTNIRFDHTHRISYTACLEMLEICFGMVNDNTQATILSSENLNALITLIATDSLLDYFHQIVEQKLKFLLKTRNPFSINIYDPESYNYKSLIKYLATVWRIFWQRIHGTIGERHSFTDVITIRYSANYLNRILKYQSFLSNIWTITSQKFSDKLINLFQHDGSNSEMISHIIDDCKDSIKNYTQEIGDNTSISIKILSNIYNQILEFIIKFGHDMNKEHVAKWLLKEANKHLSSNFSIGNPILKSLFRLAEIKNSPAILIECFSCDFVNFTRRDSDETPDLDDTDFDIISQFNLFMKENSTQYFQQLVQESMQMINLFEWFLKYNEKFSDKTSLKIFYDQLYTIIYTCYHHLCSVYNIDLVYLLMDHLIKLYTFLTNFLKHRIKYGITVDERYFLKKIITLIANKLQFNLSYTFNRIQGFMLNEEQQRENKVDVNEISKIWRYKNSVNNLIGRIDEFEQELQTLTSINREANFLEQYKKFVSDIEIKFQSAVTRTISEQQINKIFDFSKSLND